MSQMKPYCFKCGAELDPEAIYCPECGRLQRSMVVRSVDPAASSAPAAPQRDAPREQPFQFYPDREEQAEAHPDQTHYYPDSTWQQPDQPDPYAQADAAQADPYGHQDAWAAQPEAGEDHVYAQHDDQQPAQHQEPPWTNAGYDPYAQQGHEAYAQPETDYAAHAEAEPAYTEHDQQFDPGHEQAWQRAAEAPYGQQDAGYGHAQADPAYGGVEPTYGEAEPEAAAPADPWPTQPEPPPVAPPVPPPVAPPVPPPMAPPVPPPVTPPPYRPATASGRYGSAYTPPEPIYSSSAPPAPPSGGYQPYGAAQTPSRFTQAAANPYAPPYQPAGGGQQQGSNPMRLVALGVAALLGLFLIGFGIGHLLGVGNSNTGSPSAAAPPQQTVQPTSPPTTAPTSTPAATPTPDQGIVGNAKFQRVSSSIPGKCTTTQGCPIQVTLKNNGDRGSGTVTVTLTDAPNGNTMGTFTGPIPVTDAGATVTVNGFATGDQLPAYLRSGGTVYISSVDVKNGG